MFWKNFIFLCNKKNISPNRVAAELGFSTGTVTWWKKGRVPRDTAIHKIADYFNIPVEFLLSDDCEAGAEAVPAEKERKRNLIPVLGNVAAGIPIEATTGIEDFEQNNYDKFYHVNHRGKIMFKKNFIKICIDRGVSPTTVCSQIGISKSNFSNWTDNTIPRMTTLQKIADYLGVTVDDLLAEKSEESHLAELPPHSADEQVVDHTVGTLDEQEVVLLRAFRSLSVIDKAKVIVEISNMKGEDK